MSTKKRTIASMALGIWVLATVGGLGGMMALGRRPDTAADERAQWPAAVRMSHSPGSATLVVCLHPMCPCSDATIDAVEQLIRKNPDMTAYAVFAVSAERTNWLESDLIARCRSINGLTTVIDLNGTDCRTLGVRTSGQVLIYDAAGRLGFAGGLTPGRGETGAAAGQKLAADALAGGPPRTLRTPVFGCALYQKPAAGSVQ